MTQPQNWGRLDWSERLVPPNPASILECRSRVLESGFVVVSHETGFLFIALAWLSLNSEIQILDLGRQRQVYIWEFKAKPVLQSEFRDCIDCLMRV